MINLFKLDLNSIEGFPTVNLNNATNHFKYYIYIMNPNLNRVLTR